MEKRIGEIITNSIINGLGLPLSIVMMIILIINSSSALEIIFNIFISVGIMLSSIFLVLYYSIRHNIFKKFSYISFITTLTFLLISICLSNLSVISWVIFGISIGLFIINTVFSSINISWFKYITFACNLLLFIGFISMGILFSVSSLYILLITCLFLILLLYYLYDYKIFIRFLLSIIILVFYIVTYIFLLI